MMKRVLAMSLLGLSLCHATMKTHVLDIFMPWTWKSDSVYGSAACLTMINYLDKDPVQRSKLSALRAYILASQIPSILDTTNGKWGMLDNVERNLAVATISLETARSFYAASIRN